MSLGHFVFGCSLVLFPSVLKTYIYIYVIMIVFDEIIPRGIGKRSVSLSPTLVLM